MSRAILWNWNVICQICRGKIKASEATKRWDGLIVGKNHIGCFEHRHPSEFPQKLPPESKPLPFTSPEGTDTEIAVCTAEGRLSIGGYAIGGCWTAGFTGAVIDNSPVPNGNFKTNNETI